MHTSNENPQLRNTLHEIHSEYVRRSRWCVLFTWTLSLSGIALALAAALIGYWHVGLVIAFLYGLGAAAVAICLVVLHALASERLLERFMKRKVEVELLILGVDRGTAWNVACSDPVIAEKGSILKYIDENAAIAWSLRRRARQVYEDMDRGKEKLGVIWFHWLTLERRCEEVSRQETAKLRGVALLWQSLVHLLCAETQKTVYFGSPCWVESARKAAEAAKQAASYLDETSEPLIGEIIERAKIQESISEEEAEKDPSYRALAYEASVIPVPDQANILGSKLRGKNLIAFAERFEGHEILTQW